MSSPVVGWVWRHSSTRGVDRLVLLVYAEFSDDVGENTYPGARVVAEWAQVDLGTARNATDRLLANGDIELVRRGGGRGNRNEYRVVMDKGGRSATVSDDDLGGGDDELPVSAAQEAGDAPVEAVEDSEVIHSDSVEAPRDLEADFDKGGRSAPLSEELNARETREKGWGFGGPNTPLSSQDGSHTYTDTENPPTPRAAIDEAALDGAAPWEAPPGGEECGERDERVTAVLELMARREHDDVERSSPGTIRSPQRWLSAKRHELALERADALTVLAGQHPDAGVIELAELWATSQSRERARIPVERRARAMALWCTDPANPSYRSYAQLTQTELEADLVEQITQMLALDDVDAELAAVAIETFRAERARITHHIQEAS